MAGVYETAALTIFAASCSHPGESILSPGTTQEYQNFLVWSEDLAPLIVATCSSRCGIHTNDGYYSRNHLEPFQKRAWAFQEYHLSRRVLTFTSDEIQVR